jgi:2-polyprenyl-3-methyl-5-hydroxy-6-metoxy-1,4-benzoquinol methylase
MSRSQSRYVLDAREESARLERQSRMKAYDFAQELLFLPVVEGQRILDAGCGSGIVTDYLSKRARGVKVVGWDNSKERIDEARAKYGAAANISFEQRNLLEPGAVDGGFDAVVCRYVLRHFSPGDGKKVIKNLSEALRPGGTLYCIDVEGLLSDFQGSTPFLRSALKKIREAKAVDFQVARKMPGLLLEHGFRDVAWHALVSEFKGHERAQEIANLDQAMKNAEAFLEKLLGDASKLARFRAEYFSALREREELILFYNRVIAMGTKPGTALRLVPSL